MSGGASVKETVDVDRNRIRSRNTLRSRGHAPGPGPNGVHALALLLAFELPAQIGLDKRHEFAVEDALGVAGLKLGP